jgi:hypothetical protein
LIYRVDHLSHVAASTIKLFNGDKLVRLSMPILTEGEGSVHLTSSLR